MKNKSDEIKIKWLLKNNRVWSDITNSFMHIYKIFDKQRKEFYKFNSTEISTFGFNPKTSYSDNENTYMPIFSGNIALIESSSDITYEDIDNSMINLLNWLNHNIINLSHGKIDICTNKYNQNILNSDYSSNYQFINFDENNIINKNYYNRHDVSLDDIMNSLKHYKIYNKYPFKETYLYLKNIFSSNDIFLTEYVSIINSLDNNIVNKSNELKYPFKSSNSFGFGFSSLLQNSYLSSFKNFPKSVNGKFIIYNTILTKSFNEFPQFINDDCYFINCAFNKNVNLEKIKSHIKGNLIINNCLEDVYILNALAHSQITLDGLIFSHYFTGKLNELKEILNNDTIQ